MTVDTARAYFESRQVALFRDEATVTRGTGTQVYDPGTGLVVTTPGAEVYSGPCLLRQMAWQGSDVSVGETESRLRPMRVKFPKDTDIDKDDTIVPSASTYDESLIGRSFRVTDVFRDGWQIVRTVICEEVT
jgi:hypothetical protein